MCARRAIRRVRWRARHGTRGSRGRYRCCCSAWRPTTACACSVERVELGDDAVGGGGARRVALLLEQRRQLARRLDVGVIDLDHRLERADGARGVALLGGDRAMIAFGLASPLASGTSVDARSSASIAAAASPASCSACPSSICTRKLPGLSAASVFNWSSVGSSGSSGRFSAARSARESLLRCLASKLPSASRRAWR